MLCAAARSLSGFAASSPCDHGDVVTDKHKDNVTIHNKDNDTNDDTHDNTDYKLDHVHHANDNPDNFQIYVPNLVAHNHTNLVAHNHTNLAGNRRQSC